MLSDLSRAGIGAILGMLVGLLPLGVALAYAIRPRERLLALMRPLSLAAIFAGLRTLLFGLAAVSRDAADTNPIDVARLARGLSETLTPAFFAVGVLAAAWLLVAAGMRRES